MSACAVNPPGRITPWSVSGALAGHQGLPQRLVRPVPAASYSIQVRPTGLSAIPKRAHALCFGILSGEDARHRKPAPDRDRTIKSDRRDG